MEQVLDIQELPELTPEQQAERDDWLAWQKRGKRVLMLLAIRGQI